MYLPLVIVCLVITIVNSEAHINEKQCEWEYNHATRTYEFACSWEETTEQQENGFEEKATHSPQHQKHHGPLTTTPSKPEQQDEESSLKQANVNFVLYNSGIRYKQADNSTNAEVKMKVKVNCVIVVGKNNQCYGWENTQTKQHKGKKKSKDTVSSLELLSKMMRKFVDEPVSSEESDKKILITTSL